MQVTATTSLPPNAMCEHEMEHTDYIHASSESYKLPRLTVYMYLNLVHFLLFVLDLDQKGVIR